MTDSVVETYFLTDSKYEAARQATKINSNHPWTYPGDVAAAGEAPTDGENADPTNFVRKLLEAKYGKSYDTESAKAERVENPNGVARPANNYGKGWDQRKLDIYNHLTITEKVMKNPGWNGPSTSVPPNPVTLEDKQRSGTYTDEDTKLLEKAKSGSLMPKPFLILNPNGRLAGTGRGRKTRKSKMITMRRKDYLREHHHLFKVLSHPTKKKLLDELMAQQKELKERGLKGGKTRRRHK
jgi:hypothetical protein